MADKRKSISERRSQTTEAVDHMLVERNQLLALLLQVSEISPGEATEADYDILNEFCQMLVDYTAAGHFSLYERVVKKQERREGVAELAMQILPGIDETTEAALSFNEQYDPEKEAADLSRLHDDLSRLSEALTNRIELEDRLINQLLAPGDPVQA